MHPAPMHIHALRHDVVERQDPGVEGVHVADRAGRRAADDVAGAELRRVDVGEVQDGEHARDGPVGGATVDLDGFDGGRGAGGLDEDRVADLERAGFDAAGDGERVGDAAAEEVGDGHAEWLVEIAVGGLGEVECFDESRAGVPWRGGVRHVGDDVLACEPGAGDEGDGAGLEAGRGEEGRHLLLDLLESSLRPRYRVHFVDGDDDSLYTDGTDKESVFFCLPFETRFEAIGSCVDDHYGKIGLAGSGDHVGDEVPVTRRIEDGEACLFCFELVGRDIYRYSTGALV